MQLAVKEEIQVPEGVELKLEGNALEVSGSKGKLTRIFNFQNAIVRIDGKKVIIETDNKFRKSKAAVGTIKAHLKNMIKGVTEGFTYKIHIVYSHFPITVKIDSKRVFIQNFLGERAPRVADIIGDASVEVAGDDIIINGMSKDEVGQTAFNIEQATFVRYRDLRTFQDGCYIVEKG